MREIQLLFNIGLITESSFSKLENKSYSKQSLLVLLLWSISEVSFKGKKRKTSHSRVLIQE